MKLLLLVLSAALLSTVLFRLSADDRSAVTTEVQVAVRELNDGRIEFAVLHEGVFHYPRARVIRPDIGHSGWLRSSPVQIDVPLPQIGGANLDSVLDQIEVICGRQMRSFEDWRPPPLHYSVAQREAERDRVEQQRDDCRRQLNVALEVLALANATETIDPETALQYTISIDTTQLISDWTYQRMIDLITDHSIKS